MARKIVLDTDIGTNVDDALALILALNSPEIELVGVTVAAGDVEVRAQCAKAVLEAWTESGGPPAPIPIVLGAGSDLAGVRLGRWLGTEGAGFDPPADDASDAYVIVREASAAEFICQAARASPDEVDLVSIGPLTNAALAIRRAGGDGGLPLRRIVCMGGAHFGWGVEHATYEHNFGSDPQAALEVFDSRLPVYAVGLNVTRQLRLSERDRAAVRSSASRLARVVSAITSSWLRSMRRSAVYLHDPLAVAVEIQRDLVTFEPACLVAEREGTRFTGRFAHDPATEGSTTFAAASADVPRFLRLFAERVLSPLTDGVAAQHMLFGAPGAD